MASPSTDHDGDRPLVLVDGMSLTFRAYFALSTDIATSTGLVTNALHGFAAMLVSLIRDHHPVAVVVAVDLPGGTFRDEMTEDYKGGRAETPEDLLPQFDLVRDLCGVLGIPVVGVPGFEADDVLATLATWAARHQRPAIVVTGDRDTFQLVEDPWVRVLYNRRGVSDYSLYDEAGIVERCGVEPARYPLLAALRGDPSDNLPGVPGVGEKTAAKLLATYPDFDALFSHLDELTPKLRENLAAHEQLARQNLRVMTLVRDVPIDLDPSELRLEGVDRAAATAFFDRFEMNTMRGRVDKLLADGLLGGTHGDPPEPSHEEPEVDEVVRRATRLEDAFADGTAVLVAFEAGRVAALGGEFCWTGAEEEFLRFAAARGLRLSGFDVKPLYRRTPGDVSPLALPEEDGTIMAFLVDSVSGNYDLASVAQRYLGVSPTAPASLLDEASEDQLVDRARLVRRLNARLVQEIERWELGRVYRDIELPLVAVLGWMEARGIHVDKALLERIAEEFVGELEGLEQDIQLAAGHSFKVNSPQQLQKVLYDELGLTPGKKTKTGYSTDATTLEALVGEHPIVPMILRFRELDKLRGTYGQSLIDCVGPDGRIHATFNQTVARTGRISSDSPNLHNIPVRSADGRRLREAFGPEPGWRLCVADYNQIELRIIAHLSQDPGLLEAFHEGRDVHRAIAATVFKIPPDQVTHDQRELAKAVSYGLAYGMEAFGLSQRLGISVSDAKAVIDQYFGGFPTLRDYMDTTIREIRARGYSRTEYGRIRPFPDLATASGPQRQAAERQAMNAGIQGLAADIFKLALVRLDESLRGAQLAARLVLQVHDEVLVEAPAAEADRVTDVVVDALTHAATISVPLDVSVSWGDNWAAAKS